MPTDIARHDALTVARYLLTCAAAESDSEYISPLRLQKLLYYTQGWSLVVLSQPMFKDTIEAWTYGPVVASVYRHYKDYGRSGIDPPTEEEFNFDNDEKTLIEEVWDTYKDYSDVSLSRMTHNEPPWRQARGNIPDNQSSTNTITIESLEKYFAGLAESLSESKEE